jgi:putative thioredoxin
MDLMFNRGGNPPPSQGGGAAPDLVKEATTASFMADVIEASRHALVIVDFWAPWCGPCKQLGPLLEKVVREFRGAVRMVKLNVDNAKDLAAQLRVQSVPMVYAFKDGRPVDAFVGAMAETQIRQFIQRLATGAGETVSLADLVAQAKEILAEGDAETAAQAFQQVLQEDPANAPAMAGLMRCLMALGDTDQVKTVLARLPADMAKHAEIVAVRTVLELAESAGKAGSAADLRRKVAENADDHQARFDLAMAYYAANEYEAAVEELLEVVRRNRAWNDDAARKQLVKFFEAFGFGDPLSVSGRRRLSSLLFS